MTFSLKLKPKFLICSLLTLLFSLCVGYGAYFLATTEIMTDDGPLDGSAKALIVVLFAVVAVAWLFSFLVLVRQARRGTALLMDQEGIHDTLSVSLFGIFLFAVPIRRIPYDAIRFTRELGVLVAHLDKSKLDILPLFRLFVREEFRFFPGFVEEDGEEVENLLSRYVTLPTEDEYDLDDEDENKDSAEEDSEE